MKRFLSIFFLVLISFFLLTFKLLSNPPSLETDEGSIAYNSALISKNLRDQNNRFLPFFILSSDRIDWKQPVLIYLTAFIFKIFGISLLAYKLVNVSIVLITLILFFNLLKIIFKNFFYAFFGTLTLILNPIVIITTRIGNESILPIFFSTVWLLSLLLFKSKQQIRFIIINALTLGIGFYSFKGMRIIIPIWTILSCLFIFYQNLTTKINFKNFLFLFKQIITNNKFLKQIITFVVLISPFFLIIPILEIKYAGSIFDRQSVSFESVHHFFFYWLSNLSLNFWFSTPDIGKIYLVEPFGAILLTILPLFLIGLINSVKKFSIFSFVLICLVTTPMLFSLAHSINYTHRLIGAIPFIIIISTFGLKNILDKLKKPSQKKVFNIIFFTTIIINFFAFFKFYYFKYPKLSSTETYFGKNTYLPLLELSIQSKNNQYPPYIQDGIFTSEGDENKFYNVAYFNSGLKLWKLGQPLPEKAILLTQNKTMENFTNISSEKLSSDFNILISN